MELFTEKLAKNSAAQQGIMTFSLEISAAYQVLLTMNYASCFDCAAY